MGTNEMKDIPITGITETDSKYFVYSIKKSEGVSISRYIGPDENVVIPRIIEGMLVTTISRGAFQGLTHVEEVSMSDDILTMQGDAFKKCTNLRKIHISNGVSKIVATSFVGCTKLEEVNIPDNVTELKSTTFKDSPIKVLHIGKSFMDIEINNFYQSSFNHRNNMWTRSINCITVDGKNPYLKTVDYALFSKDGKILYAYFGSDSSYAIPGGVEKIAGSAFGWLGNLTKITMPASLVSIGVNAFEHTGLKKIKFGPNVKIVEEGAFDDCTKLKEVVLNDGLEIICDSAFGDDPIKKIFLPASVKTIGRFSFAYLEGIYWEQDVHFQIDSANPYLYTDGKALYVNCNEEKALQSIYGSYDWGPVFDYKVADGTVVIKEQAMAFCKGMVKVILPESVKSIGEEAFLECENLEEINLPNSVETIGASAFRWTKIKKFSLGPNVKEIGDYAFVSGGKRENRRTKINSITVSRDNPIYYVENKMLLKRKQDGTSAIVVFFGSDEKVIIPDSISEICNGAFTKSAVKEMQIPASLTKIGESAFASADKIVRVNICVAEPGNDTKVFSVSLPSVKVKQHNDRDVYIHSEFLKCIHADSSGPSIDFAKYDELFEKVHEDYDKILIAIDRLTSDIQLDSLRRDEYCNYLQMNVDHVGFFISKLECADKLKALLKLNLYKEKDIDQFIRVARYFSGNPKILRCLMDYKDSVEEGE